MISQVTDGTRGADLHFVKTIVKGNKVNGRSDVVGDFERRIRGDPIFHLNSEVRGVSRQDHNQCYKVTDNF